MKRRLTIDARWLVGGIGTYTRHLLEGLAAHGDGYEIHVITQNVHRRSLMQWCSHVTLLDTPIYSIREQWQVPCAARSCDLLHVPHYNAPIISPVPLVVSILDLIHVTAYARDIRSWLYARPMLNLVARRACRIITISQYSKREIVNKLGISESKVSVIYCGVSKTFQPFDQQAARNKVRNELGIQQPYMLYVGSLKPYKNICLLLKAFSLLLKRGVSHQLVILGDDKRWKDSLIRESSRLGIEHKTRFIPYVQSDLLPELYSGADLLVMPSRIEGFGLPVLEAMACGTPVVCSQAASLPEVGGDAVLYFDPSSPDDLAQKIECLIDSAALRMELRAKGLQRSKHFTWNKCVEQHLAVYQSILH